MAQNIENIGMSFLIFERTVCFCYAAAILTLSRLNSERESVCCVREGGLGGQGRGVRAIAGRRQSARYVSEGNRLEGQGNL